jgi:hypothetical protein
MHACMHSECFHQVLCDMHMCSAMCCEYVQRYVPCIPHAHACAGCSFSQSVTNGDNDNDNINVTAPQLSPCMPSQVLHPSRELTFERLAMATP